MVTQGSPVSTVLLYSPCIFLVNAIVPGKGMQPINIIREKAKILFAKGRVAYLDNPEN